MSKKDVARILFCALALTITNISQSFSGEIKSRPSYEINMRWAISGSYIEKEKEWLDSCYRGACRDKRYAHWQRVIDLIRAAPQAIKVTLIHRMVNRGIAYTPEDVDAWQSPLATLTRKAGDCEDHALLKRAFLTAAGIDGSELVLLQTANQEGHLVVFVNGVVLDNRYNRPVSVDLLERDRIVAKLKDPLKATH